MLRFQIFRNFSHNPVSLSYSNTKILSRRTSTRSKFRNNLKRVLIRIVNKLTLNLISWAQKSPVKGGKSHNILAEAMGSSRNCCRLCLAPENECVAIFKTQAADKQSIQSKISSCIQIQVSENVHFKLRLSESSSAHLPSKLSEQTTTTTEGCV